MLLNLGLPIQLQRFVAMPLIIIDCQTSASGHANEDRAGAARDLAWVIDGATDVVERPLTGSATDADWIAAHLDGALKDPAVAPPAELSQLPDLTAARLASEFAHEAERAPIDKTEHPSASAVVVRACGAAIDYVSIGDCTLLVEGSNGFRRVGVDAVNAGDPQLAKALEALHAEHGGLEAANARARIWPSIRAGRAAMNEPNGYGVFSIMPTPRHFVQTGRIAMPAYGHALLASDGLMRLVDVFRFYTALDLFAAARQDGITPLIRKLREIESDDIQGHRYKRAKISDDATGLLLTWSP
jgi:hypothetical protein